MKIKIGEKIKLLRRENSITQERLAEYLGVTAQAVSRWESENSYPDIEILPTIASFFNITIDALLGYNASEKEQTDIVNRINRLLVEGRSSEAISEARKGLALYRQNRAIAIMLASQIFTGGPNKDLVWTDEAIALTKRILRDCTSSSDHSDVLRITTKSILIRALCKRDRLDEANAISLTLPSFVMSQEIIRQTVLKGDERIQYSLSMLPVLITMLNSSFLHNLAYAESDKAKPLFEYSTKECLRDTRVWDAVYTGIDPAVANKEKESLWIYMFLHQRLVKTLMDQGNKKDALTHFQRAVDCVRHVDSNQPYFSYNLSQRNALITRDPLCKEDNYHGKSSAYVLYHGYIENGYYTDLEDKPEFINSLHKLKEYME